MSNTGYMFYKRYYILENRKLVVNQNAHQQILNLNDSIHSFETGITKKPWTHTLEMKVLYPGLITGVGIPHSIKADAKDGSENGETEFKVGFQFDYTTGLPIVLGSSVKGVVRNFIDRVIDSESDEVLSMFNQMAGLTLNIEELEAFYKSLFNEEPEKVRCVFFDVEISEFENFVLGEDYITPHKSITENPTPIKFLKILPNTCLEFRFKVVDIQVGEKLVRGEQILDMIRKILLMVGVGAKTNVGYGQFNRSHSETSFKVYTKELEERKEKEKRKELQEIKDREERETVRNFYTLDTIEKFRKIYLSGDKEEWANQLDRQLTKIFHGDLKVEETSQAFQQIYSRMDENAQKECLRFLSFKDLELDEKKEMLTFIEDIMEPKWQKYKAMSREQLENIVSKKKNSKEVKRYILFNEMKSSL